jgi:hypothetical protein
MTVNSTWYLVKEWDLKVFILDSSVTFDWKNWGQSRNISTDIAGSSTEPLQYTKLTASCCTRSYLLSITCSSLTGLWRQQLNTVKFHLRSPTQIISAVLRVPTVYLARQIRPDDPEDNAVAGSLQKTNGVGRWQARYTSVYFLASAHGIDLKRTNGTVENSAWQSL